MTLYRPVRVVVLFALLGGAYAAILFVLINKTSAPSRIAVGDVEDYFNYAAGVLGGGAAYREVASPYPLLANILFATVRLVTSLFDPRRDAFVVAWSVIAGVVYVVVLDAVIARAPKLGVLAWLAPAPIYFALLRYDIYPAAATLLALFAIRRESYFWGAAWLGIAIALKGYALFLLPAFCIFVAERRSLTTAAQAGALAVAPTIFCLAVTIALTGWQGMTAPFSFHADRTMTEESTYAAVNYLFGATVIPSGGANNWIGHALQLACALIPAALRPRSFDDLLDAFLFALLGFIVFLAFHSPQYVLWVLPITCLSSSRAILTLALIFSWLSYLHLHLLSALIFSLLDAQQLYRLDVIAVNVFHFSLMAVAAYHLLSRRRNLDREQPIWEAVPRK
jgi:hypothetical protein